MPRNRIQDLSQERAQFAFDRVTDARDNLEGKSGEFKSHVKKVPLMIRNNGLCATFSFVLSKTKTGNEKNSYAYIEEICRDWLISQKILKPEGTTPLANILSNLDRDQYRRVMRELLALFTWLKRFADGLIEKEAA